LQKDWVTRRSTEDREKSLTRRVLLQPSGRTSQSDGSRKVAAYRKIAGRGAVDDGQNVNYDRGIFENEGKRNGRGSTRDAKKMLPTGMEGFPRAAKRKVKTKEGEIII